MFFKKVSLFLLLIVFILPITISANDQNTNYIVDEIENKTIYPNSEHELVFSLKIPGNTGPVDYLKTITLFNNHSDNNKNIASLHLWIDGGQPGFQATKDDVLYAQADWDSTSNHWQFRNINLYIPYQNHLQLFFTIKSSKEITERSNIQLAIDKLVDYNNNGMFEPGELGIFTSQKNNGPYDNDLVSPTVFQLSPLIIDNTAPEISILIDEKLNNHYILENLLSPNMLISVNEDEYSNINNVIVNLNKKVDNTWQPIDEYRKDNIHQNSFSLEYPIPTEKNTYQITVQANNESSPEIYNILHKEFVIDSTYTAYKNGWYKLKKVPQTLNINVFNEIEVFFREKDFFTLKKDTYFDKSTTILENETFFEEKSYTNNDGVLTIKIKPEILGEFNLVLAENDIKFLSIPLNAVGTLTSGSIFKTKSGSTIYFYAKNGKRYTFTNNKVYNSWYENYDNVIEIDDNILSQIPFGGIVLYKPGYRMLKLQTDPKVYAVDKNGQLRWVTTEKIAISLYGESWNQFIDDISDAYFFNYSIAQPITNSNDFNTNQPSQIINNVSPPVN